MVGRPRLLSGPLDKPSPLVACFGLIQETERDTRNDWQLFYTAVLALAVQHASTPAVIIRDMPTAGFPLSNYGGLRRSFETTPPWSNGPKTLCRQVTAPAVTLRPMK